MQSLNHERDDLIAMGMTLQFYKSCIAITHMQCQHFLGCYHYKLIAITRKTNYGNERLSEKFSLYFFLWKTLTNALCIRLRPQIAF